MRKSVEQLNYLRIKGIRYKSERSFPSVAECEGPRVRQNENFSGFGQHNAAKHQLRIRDFADRITLFGVRRKEFTLAGNVIVHGNHNRCLDLIYDLHNVLEA